MRKTKKLQLSRETLRHLATPESALRGAAGGAKTTPLTDCAATICVATCIVKLCNPTLPPACSGKVICGQ
jgi:hypothetical protein